MTNVVTANKIELLAIADSVAREKLIDKSIVLEAMEDAIQRAAKARYGNENDIHVKLDSNTGDIEIWRILEVVENPENIFTQIDVESAQEFKKGAKLGDQITDPLPLFDFGRIAAQTGKQAIVQKVRDAERARQYEEYKDRVGEVVIGAIRRIEFGHVIVDLGRAEGILRRDQQIPRENMRMNDRIRCYIMAVKSDTKGPQIFLSRTHGEFMKKLFAQEVPEIYDGVIEIKAVARDPGSRAKIAVISSDSAIDPVGACVGMKGSRVQAVVQELQEEKVDIIPWSPNPATFIVNALQPATVSKVIIDEDEGRIDVVVPDDQLSLAIGRRGQNVRLASQLTGWNIDIMTEEKETEKRQKEFMERSEMFQNELDVDETLAQLLVAEGFTELEELSLSDISELASIEGFDEDLASELRQRAEEAIARKEEAMRAELQKLGVDESLIGFAGINNQMRLVLAEQGIKTLDDLADLSSDELASRKDGLLKDFALSQDEANEIIMQSRSHWFEDEEVPSESSSDDHKPEGDSEEALPEGSVEDQQPEDSDDSETPSDPESPA